MQRVYRGLFLGLVVFLAGMVFYIVQHRVLPTYAPAQAGLLEVHFIDVGQGDSIFIRTPDGKTALIDGGPGRSGVLAYLQAHGVTALDVVVATHPHEDHIGGLIAVMDSLPVGGIWTSGASHTTLTYERFLDVIAARRIPKGAEITNDYREFDPGLCAAFLKKPANGKTRRKAVGIG